MSVAFDWEPHQLALHDELVELARSRLNDGADERDRDGVFSRDLWRACAEAGIQGLVVPAELGGRGLDPLTAALALEGLGYGCLDGGLVFALGAHLWSCVLPLLRFGTDEQRARHLPGLCDGSTVGVGAASEPEAGSDVLSLRASARREGSEFVLDGEKTFVTCAPVADLFLVFASTDPELGFAGISAFLVERETAGLHVSEPLPKMGLRSAPMGELRLESCRVPAGDLLGPLGGGTAVFSTAMEWERALILAPALGTMRRQLEECVEWAGSRRQFGRPIGSFQAVAHRIVEMRMRLEASRLLLYRVAWLKAEGRPAAVDAALAKAYVSEAFVRSSLDALQLHGARGYLSEDGVERVVRDALAARIYSGTSEIQRNVVAADLGL